MKSEQNRDDATESRPKVPYQRPELKWVGKLRDVTTQKTGGDT